MSTLFDKPVQVRVLPTEQQIGDRITREIGSSGWRREVLDVLRERLKIVYQSRLRDAGPSRAYVTADDARVLLLSLDIDLRGENMNFLGALFKSQGWEPMPYMHQSDTPGSHGNLLHCWRFVGERQ